MRAAENTAAGAAPVGALMAPSAVVLLAADRADIDRAKVQLPEDVLLAALRADGELRGPAGRWREHRGAWVVGRGAEPQCNSQVAVVEPDAHIGATAAVAAAMVLWLRVVVSSTSTMSRPAVEVGLRGGRDDQQRQGCENEQSRSHTITSFQGATWIRSEEVEYSSNRGGSQAQLLQAGLLPSQNSAETSGSAAWSCSRSSTAGSAAISICSTQGA